jgi:predicted regulator of Ras-like GTPase activity (Roadblock/LC7/MglB family)
MGKKVGTGLSDGDPKRRGIIAKVLRTMLRNTNARGALLVDKGGRLLAREGASSPWDVETLTTLVAGSFAATRQMASLLGEKEYAVTFHHGNDHIQLFLVGSRSVLAVIFDNKTTQLMVRLYAEQVAAKLGEFLDRKPPGPDDSPPLRPGFP